MKNKNIVLLVALLVFIGWQVAAPVKRAAASAVHKASLIMGAAASWAAATSGDTGADHGIYWKNDGHPYAHYTGGSEVALDKLASTPFFDFPNWSAQTLTAGTTGDFSNGAILYFDSSVTVKGCRWYQPVGFTNNVTCSFWYSTGAGGHLGASVTVTPTAGAINTALFASPYSFVLGTSVGGSTAYKQAITVRDGVHQILYNAGPVSPSPEQAGLLWGPHLSLQGFGTVAGLGSPTSVSINFTGIEPIYTVP